MKTRIWSLFALMLVLCLVLMACSSNDGSNTVTTTDPAPAVPSAAADDDETVPVVEIEIPVEQPEPNESDMPLEVEVDVDVDLGINLPEGIFAGATAALEALESYRFTTSFLYMGEEDGEIDSGSIELSGEMMDATHKRFVWRDLNDGEYFEIIQIGNDAWIHDGDEWEAVPAMVADAMSQAILVFAPSVAWGGMFGGLETNSSYVGTETIDGIQAHHYTSTYQQWAGYWEGDLLDAIGDVWIADAGYPLRYDFTATGIDEDGSRSTISWTMTLTDVGTNIVIEPPL
ncbi:hypothetical protein KAH43_08455 [Candidatus Bipolaricaulota bacterium]|nr:hypothetical protein [Candidatus Bipolaricaulota bacterium]